MTVFVNRGSFADHAGRRRLMHLPKSFVQKLLNDLSLIDSPFYGAAYHCPFL